jgi:hypothetical protein
MSHALKMDTNTTDRSENPAAPGVGSGALLGELEAAKRRIAELEQLANRRPDYSQSSWVENGVQYYRCGVCGKVVKEGRWLGTLHLCA